MHLEHTQEQIASPSQVEEGAGNRWLNWSSFVITVLQSACTALMVISLLALAETWDNGKPIRELHTPAHGFHSDIIRVPMMAIALIGSVLNLFVIWKVRKLRNRPAAQWRQKPISPQKLRSERFQIALSILTLLLLAAEWITHPMIHRVPLFS